jgi:signal transduction histidine kinase/DNA-binding response OmpR family regulator
MMAFSSIYTRTALHQALTRSENADRIIQQMTDVFSVRIAFNDLRYWQTDLAVGQLGRAEINAAEARKRLSSVLPKLATSYPDYMRQIEVAAAEFDKYAKQAIALYRKGDRLAGDTQFARAREFGSQVNVLLWDVQRKLVTEFLAEQASLLPPFANAAEVATGLTALAVTIGAFLTFVILRSILGPMSRIVRAVHGLTSDNPDVEIPPRSADEFGRVTDALRLLSYSLKERDHLARETERQRKTLSDAIESIAEGFTLYDANDRLVVANQRFRNIHPAFAALAEKHAPFSAIVDAGEQHVVRSRVTTEEPRTDQGHRTRGIVQLYDDRWIQISARETHEGGFTVVYTDITELRKRQEELEEARDQAQRANQVKSRFLANMSHELRTPLNAIIGYSQILQEDLSDRGQQDFLPDVAKIEVAGNHLLSLINDILDLSKIEAGRMEIYKEWFNVADLVGDVEMLVRPLASRHDNILVIKCPPHIGSVESDITKIKQTLLNLLSNAAKFTKEGTIELLVERSGEADACTLTFSVSDTGIGMDEEQLGRLFQAFSQADNSTSSKFGGTGLGLAISRSFAQMLGGELTVTSKAGEGSRFVFAVPVAATYDDDALADNEPGWSEADNDRLAPCTTLLVVGQDPTALDFLNSHLSREGFRLLFASGGGEALQLARSKRPSAIALDIMMLWAEGCSVLAMLKGEPEIADIPIVLVSVSNERALGFTLGAAAILTKPVDGTALSDFIVRLSQVKAGTVLVVEDDGATLDLMQRTVERVGYSAVLTRNGCEAMDWLRINQPPVIVLLDLNMPEMNGFEFLARLRENENWRAIPVLVVTGKQLTLAERGVLSRCAAQVITKGQGAYLELSQALRVALGQGACAGQRVGSDGADPCDPPR